MAHHKFNTCITALDTCAAACNHCLTACLKEEDVKMMAGCIALDIDCAQFCAFTAGAVARDSEHAADICARCADVCQACADECGKHDMGHCQECAKACLQCVEECRKMATMA